MSDIVLSTLNARYAHAAFGLRYLMANLEELAGRAVIREFDISRRPLDVAEAILADEPKIVGLGVYIWNAEQSLQVAAAIKRVRPGVVLILGGPEVSFETDQQPICAIADYIITGEADLAFAELCRRLLLEGEAPARPSLRTVIAAGLPRFSPLPVPTPSGRPGEGGGNGAAGDAGEGARGTVTFPMAKLEGEAPAEPVPSRLPRPQPSPGITVGDATLSLPGRGLMMPYHLYTADDLAHRVVYVEASRGCPFSCEFCLSSLDIPVRAVPLDVFLPAMQDLLDRGCRQFKFVDRTFNLNVNTSVDILRFFLDRFRPGLFLHFEMIPDRLPAALREMIAKFPAGVLQFEVGVQSFNEDVTARIGRRQDNAKVEENLRFLKQQTGVHVHADLIVGLPGEDIDSFAAGFDRLLGLGVQEIQVGILKRLRGTPIGRHDAEWGVAWSPHAPYEILQNKLIDFGDMQKLRRFARFWDLLANSGNFATSVAMLWGQSALCHSEQSEESGPFAGRRSFADAQDDGRGAAFRAFWELSLWLHARAGQSHGIALNRLAELLFEYLTTRCGVSRQDAAAAIWADYLHAGRREGPEFLRELVKHSGTRSTLPPPHPGPLPRGEGVEGPPRQTRHLGKMPN